MQITYATSHRWKKPISENLLDSFGKNAQTQLRTSLSQLKISGLQICYEKLDQQFLDRFIPLYEERLTEKKHPVIFNIQGKTLGSEHGDKYYSQSVWEHKTFIGGAIYSIRDTRLKIAYRTFARTWNTARLRANPSLLAEYDISRHAQSLSLETIIHGKDRNPYGLNSGIGLAIFKLSVGCYPEKCVTYEVRTIDSATIIEDALVLEYPGDQEKKITHGYLITTKAKEDVWNQVKQYPERLRITTLYRPE